MALTRPRYSQIYDTDYKQSCKLATTADVGNLIINTGITNTVDSTTVLVGDRILVKDQADGTQNGIYRVVTIGTGSNGSWVRDHDADSQGINKVSSGLTTTITGGTSNQTTTWKLITPDPITVGSTILTFVNQTALPGGLNTQVQFNNSGSLAGASGFTYNTSTSTLTATNIYVQGNLFVPNLTSLTTQILQVNDPLLYLRANTIYPYGYDIGLYGAFVGGPANIYAHTGLVRSDADGSWYLFSNVPEPSAGQVSVNDADAIYDKLVLGNILLKTSTGITTDKTTINLVNTTATTVNLGGAATSISIGASTGSTLFNSTNTSTSPGSGAVVVSGGVGISGNLNVGYFANPSLYHYIRGNVSLIGAYQSISGNLSISGGNIVVSGNLTAGSLSTPGSLHTLIGNVNIIGNTLSINSVQVPTIVQMLTFNLAF